LIEKISKISEVTGKTKDDSSAFDPDKKIDKSDVKGDLSKDEYNPDAKIEKSEAFVITKNEFNPDDKIKKDVDFNELSHKDIIKNMKDNKEKNEPWELPETKQEKIAYQNIEIRDIENGTLVLNTNAEKGNYGEMKTDQFFREHGYDRISRDMTIDIRQPGHQGIDGVYYNIDGHPPYAIGEAKYGSSKLSSTLDGMQMSDTWQNKRLDAAVGKKKADEIREAKLLGNCESYLAHIDEYGNVELSTLDENANIIEKGVVLNA
jgi:hypothetical protein